MGRCGRRDGRVRGNACYEPSSAARFSRALRGNSWLAGTVTHTSCDYKFQPRAGKRMERLVRFAPNSTGDIFRPVRRSPLFHFAKLHIEYRRVSWKSAKKRKERRKITENLFSSLRKLRETGD